MVDIVARSKITDVIYARLSRDADLYTEILDLCRRERIETGLVLNIVGGLKQARLSFPLAATKVEGRPGIRQWTGEVIECSGFGIIGRSLDTWDSRDKSGIFYQAGEPYLHIHLTITVAGETYMGHLIEGCIVRSLHEKSHFTIVVAKTEGVLLNSRASEERTEHYPKGILIHELLQLST